MLASDSLPKMAATTMTTLSHKDHDEENQQNDKMMMTQRTPVYLLFAKENTMAQSQST